jgi:hypothetical protein
VGDERAHSTWCGEGQRFSIVNLAPLGIEPAGMSRDVAKQMQRMRRKAGMPRRELDGAIGQALRLVESAQQQSGPTQRVVGPGEVRHDSSHREALDDLFGQRDLAQRFGRFAEVPMHAARVGQQGA